MDRAEIIPSENAEDQDNEACPVITDHTHSHTLSLALFVSPVPRESAILRTIHSVLTIFDTIRQNLSVL